MTGSGTLYQNENNSPNTLFRDLRADWQSLRLKVASFSLFANCQQVAATSDHAAGAGPSQDRLSGQACCETSRFHR